MGGSGERYLKACLIFILILDYKMDLLMSLKMSWNSLGILLKASLGECWMLSLESGDNLKGNLLNLKRKRSWLLVLNGKTLILDYVHLELESLPVMMNKRLFPLFPNISFL